MIRQRTPGPVRIDPRASTRVVAGEDDTIATTGLQSDLRDEWEANAAFIVRAWNAHDAMLAALKEVLEHVEDEHTPRIDNQCTLCATYRRKMRDAITAAERVG